MDTRKRRAPKRVDVRRRSCSYDGRLYRRPDEAVDRGYAEFHESRLARYEACSDS